MLTATRSGVFNEQLAGKGYIVLGSRPWDGFPLDERANSSGDDAPETPTILDVERTKSYQERTGTLLRIENMRERNAHPGIYKLSPSQSVLPASARSWSATISTAAGIQALSSWAVPMMLSKANSMSVPMADASCTYVGIS